MESSIHIELGVNPLGGSYMLATILNSINNFFWNIPFISFVLLVGLYFMIGSKFFSIIHFGHILNHTIFSATDIKKEKKAGTVSPFEAVCIAIGGSVGVGCIGGVATAVATGGPGAVFWMWIWAFFGMMIKCVETSLSVYYRTKNERGEYYGGSTYFIEKGIGHQMHHPKLGKYLAIAFGIGFVAQFLGGSQVYTIAEILNKSFGINMILVTLIYSAFLFYIIFKGVPRIAAFATKIVPLMCVLVVIGGVIIIVINYQAIPSTLYMIFHDAFTGTAATGGFAGAAVTKVIGDGLARSMNANEAGQGSAPFIYGSANTIHPIRQGLWGSFDVFVNTIVVCSITALAVLTTGVWNSGFTGATLTITAFEHVFGQGGDIFLGIIALLFGITTTSGWFTYYVAVINHGFRCKPQLRDTLIKTLKFIYPLPNIIIVTSIVLTGNGPDTFWTIVNITLIAPIFTNLLALVILRHKFWELLKDYKARIGQIDPNFHVFYEDDPNVFAKEEALRKSIQNS